MSTDDPRTGPQATMFGNRLRKLARHRRKWARREGISCYRLYDRDIPELPLVVDWYEGRALMACHLREGEGDEAWITAMASSLAEALQIDLAKVFVKQHRRQSGDAQYERLDDAGKRFSVEEAGLRYLVNLSDYLDTGLFLDHRQTRAMVRAEAKDRRVLNLFSYTGSFSVAAAAGGARQTTSVDMSRTYLDWARENLELNGFGEEQHLLMRMDVSSFLRMEVEERYDLAVVDPPTFSNSKRMAGTFDIQRDHPWLIRRVMNLVDWEGKLYFSTNRKRFKLETEGMEKLQIEEISDHTVPDDFSRRRPHRCFRVTHA